MTSTYSISFRGPVRGVCLGLTLTTLAAASALAQIPPPELTPSFADAVLFGTVGVPRGMDAADLDGDGDPDLVVATGVLAIGGSGSGDRGARN